MYLSYLKIFSLLVFSHLFLFISHDSIVLKELQSELNIAHSGNKSLKQNIPLVFIRSVSAIHIQGQIQFSAEIFDCKYLRNKQPKMPLDIFVCVISYVKDAARRQNQQKQERSRTKKSYSNSKRNPSPKVKFLDENSQITNDAQVNVP